MTNPDDTASPSVVVPLVEASSRLGVSVAALRSRIRRGVVTARRGNDNRLHIEIPADARPRQDDATGSSDEFGLELDTLRAELLEARIAAARWQERAGAQAELVAELKLQLAELRQSWWKRWFGR